MTERTRLLPFPWLLILLPALTVAASLLGLCCGSASLSLTEVWQGILKLDPASAESQILWVVRIPHVAGCLLAGAALSVSGVLLQTATDNPLAGPNIIGVNAGAGFAMVLGMCVAPMAYRLLPLMAFLGAFACTLLVVLIANRAGGARVTIVLAGVAVSTLFSAGISLLKLLYPDLAISYHAFSVGGVSGVTLSDLQTPALLILFILLVSLLCSPRLNLLCLGDALAGTLGVRVRLLRTLTLLLASAAAAAAVSFAGLLGFVGLMVHHAEDHGQSRKPAPHQGGWCIPHQRGGRPLLGKVSEYHAARVLYVRKDLHGAVLRRR